MNHIDELIAQRCPDGVQRLTFNEIIENLRTGLNPRQNFKLNGPNATGHYITVRELSGFRITPSEKTDLVDDNGLRRIQARSKLRPGDVLFSGTGTIGRTALVDEEPLNWNIKEGVYAITPKNETITPKFLIYLLHSTPVRQKILASADGSTVASVSMATLRSIKVPVPPLEVQREIVRILDTFSELEAELEAELAARQTQFEHYRAKILSEASSEATPVQLGQLGKVITGRTPRSVDKAAWGSEIDFITPSDIENGMKLITNPSRRLSQAGVETMVNAMVPSRSILVTCIGTVGKTVINSNACVTNQQINSLLPTEEVDVDFLFHTLTSMRHVIRKQGERSGGTMPMINKTDFSRIEVRLPSLLEQKKAAAYLNKFDALVNDVSSGLPAEIHGRRKQYEYYRDKLLTFEELPA